MKAAVLPVDVYLYIARCHLRHHIFMFHVTGVSMLILIMINCAYVYIGEEKRNQMRAEWHGKKDVRSDDFTCDVVVWK